MVPCHHARRLKLALTLGGRFRISPWCRNFGRQIFAYTHTRLSLGCDIEVLRQGGGIWADSTRCRGAFVAKTPGSLRRTIRLHQDTVARSARRARAMRSSGLAFDEMLMLGQLRTWSLVLMMLAGEWQVWLNRPAARHKTLSIRVPGGFRPAPILI